MQGALSLEDALESLFQSQAVLSDGAK
jgi:hypothetical protein